MGSGDCLEDLKALRDELGLADHVEFTGRVPDESSRASCQPRTWACRRIRRTR